MLIAIAGEHRKDRTVSGVYMSDLQKWRAHYLPKCLLILFALLLYACRRMAAIVDGGCKWCMDDIVSRVYNAWGIT